MKPVDRVNFLNVLLMVAAGGAALMLPFELFLFAYAVLGPLHYLTEIAWLHQRSYFGTGRADLLLLLAPTLGLVALYFTSASTGALQAWSMTLLGGAFVAAFAIATIASAWGKFALVVAGFALAYAVRDVSAFRLGFLVLLPTLIHVFLFTAAFMALGALRENSASGWSALAALFTACAAVLAAPVGEPISLPSEGIRDAYGSFLGVNQSVLRWLGFPTRNYTDVMATSAAVKLQRFIAFVYTYHYLNWFSKTSVIQWQRIPKAWAVTNLVLWLVSVGVYAWDYRVGLSVLYSLSLAHVILEFPLNHKTFLAIGEQLRRRVFPAANAGAA